MSTPRRQVRVNLLGKGYSCVPRISFDDLSSCDLMLGINLADALAD